MIAYSEKSWAYKELGDTRSRLHTLSTVRSGLYLEPDGVNPTKLAQLLQDIARARIEEMRITSLIKDIEARVEAMLESQKKTLPKEEAHPLVEELPPLKHKHSLLPVAARFFPIALVAMSLAPRPR